MTQLTKTQEQVLILASKRDSHIIEPLPSHINAGIKPRVIQGLLTRELITAKEDSYIISAKGFEAIGATPSKIPAPTTTTPRRQGTKRATVIALLERDQGVSIEELQAATHWQKHTIRGTIATLKKQKNLNIVSVKEDGERRYYLKPLPQSKENLDESPD